jgi:hypothetical protein
MIHVVETGDIVLLIIPSIALNSAATIVLINKMLSSEGKVVDF